MGSFVSRYVDLLTQAYIAFGLQVAILTFICWFDLKYQPTTGSVFYKLGIMSFLYRNFGFPDWITMKNAVRKEDYDKKIDKLKKKRMRAMINREDEKAERIQKQMDAMVLYQSECTSEEGMTYYEDSDEVPKYLRSAKELAKMLGGKHEKGLLQFGGRSEDSFFFL